ncbi:MAG: protein kinase [Nitrospirae bacterium]|nr:protein kinase [Nitrospirota bacterium]
MLNMTIEIVEGLRKGHRFTIGNTETFIVGRSEFSDLQIGTSDMLVSRNHCMMEVHHDKCVVTDLNSKNGTKVNGRKVTTTVLNNMDEIKVGNTVMRVIIAKCEMHSLVCGSCGAVLSEDDFGIYGRDAENEGHLCAKCWDKQLKSMKTVDYTSFFELAGSKGKTFICCKCSSDVSKTADSDGLANEFPDSTYMCHNCIDLQVKNVNINDMDKNYFILDEIGRGGMGIVFKAVHKKTGRICALKKIHPSTTPDTRTIKIFEREILVQSNIIHPNLVRIMDKGVVGGNIYYFVMEYIQGGSIPSLMKNTKGMVLAPKTATSITIDVLKGLQAMHTSGFVHRDIKPSNVLLSSPANEGCYVAKICDYGLAKSFVNSGNSMIDITKTKGGLAGSILYMSPEIISNFKYAKPPVDLYSAGVTLYFMLTCKFTVNIPDDFFKKLEKNVSKIQRHPLDIILDEAPIPILNRKPDIPKSLAAVVDKAVTKRIGKGYRDAGEFILELEGVMELEGWNK